MSLIMFKGINRHLIDIKHRYDTGFSLLELLVVTTIVAILSTTVMFTLRLGQSQAPMMRLAEFQRGLKFLQDDAFFTNRSYAIEYSEDGWRVLEFRPETRSWAVRDPRLPNAKGSWGRSETQAIFIEGREIVLRETASDDPSPDTILLPSREATPTVISLNKNKFDQAHCMLSNFGDLLCGRSEPCLLYTSPSPRDA